MCSSIPLLNPVLLLGVKPTAPTAAADNAIKDTANDDDEEDPLDAFMADISEKAKTTRAEPKV